MPLPSARAVAPRSHRDAEHAHSVEFHEDDDFLCDVPADFVAAAVEPSRPALLIAPRGSLPRARRPRLR